MWLAIMAPTIFLVALVLPDPVQDAFIYYCLSHLNVNSMTPAACMAIHCCILSSLNNSWDF